MKEKHVIDKMVSEIMAGAKQLGECRNIIQPIVEGIAKNLYRLRIEMLRMCPNDCYLDGLELKKVQTKEGDVNLVCHNCGYSINIFSSAKVIEAENNEPESPELFGGLIRVAGPDPRTFKRARISREDVGRYFTTTGTDIWKVETYCHESTATLRNLATGEKKDGGVTSLNLSKFTHLLPETCDQGIKNTE